MYPSLANRIHENWAHGGAQFTVHTSAGSLMNRLVWLTGQMLPKGVPGAEAADSPILLDGRCITQFGVLKVLAGERIPRPACGYGPGDIPVRAENDGATKSATCKGQLFGISCCATELGIRRTLELSVDGPSSEYGNIEIFMRFLARPLLPIGALARG